LLFTSGFHVDTVRVALLYGILDTSQYHRMDRRVMAIPLEVLEAEVLGLSPAERSRLLDKLLASLDPDPEWEKAWAQEADRREAAIEAGTAKWIAGDEVVARLRAQLK